jgi:signal transduction histidine kinase
VQARTAELQARTAELLVANEAIQGFTAAAAHDLSTPLTSIVGFSVLLTRNWETFSEESRRKFVSSIDRQSHKMSTLVDNLLALASIDAGGLHTSPELIVLGKPSTGASS